MSSLRGKKIDPDVLKKMERETKKKSQGHEENDEVMFISIVPAKQGEEKKLLGPKSKRKRKDLDVSDNDDVDTPGKSCAFKNNDIFMFLV